MCLPQVEESDNILNSSKREGTLAERNASAKRKHLEQSAKFSTMGKIVLYSCTV